jgi:major vault protein
MRAKVVYNDKITKKEYKPGQRWLIRGPIDFIPDNEAEVVEKRKALSLAENEGVYMRDLKNGEVKLVKGPQIYMLTEYEELWVKNLIPEVEKLVALNKQGIDYMSNNMQDEINRAKG